MKHAKSIAILKVNKTRVLPSGTVLGTKVQKGHKGALFLGDRHYTESNLLSVKKIVYYHCEHTCISHNHVFDPNLSTMRSSHLSGIRNFILEHKTDAVA